MIAEDQDTGVGVDDKQLIKKRHITPDCIGCAHTTGAMTASQTSLPSLSIKHRQKSPPMAGLFISAWIRRRVQPVACSTAAHKRLDLSGCRLLPMPLGRRGCG